MPLLYAKDRLKMLGSTDRFCPNCNMRIFRNYCRRHDVFFDVCNCAKEENHEGRGTNDKEEHITYLCQNQDFDCPQVIEVHCPRCDIYICSACAHNHDCLAEELHWLGDVGPQSGAKEHCHCQMLR